MKTWALGMILTLLLLPHIHGTAENSRAGCRTVANDLVYIIDGSSSVGVADFDMAKQWLINVTGNFAVGPRHTQVAIVQYSDTPRLEVPLGQHRNSRELIRAIQAIGYLGGSTRTGRALKFAIEHVFPSSGRAGTAQHRIAVVVTDGKSQDDVVDAALEARAQGIVVFAVGVGSEASGPELAALANRPSSTYVLHAEDYATIGCVQDAMQQKLCEESVCPIQTSSFPPNERGFELLSSMKIDQKAPKVQGSLVSEVAYLLSPGLDLTESTRAVFPQGLPPSYVFVATLRLKAPANRAALDLWRIRSKDGSTQTAVTLDGRDKSVIFTTTSSVRQEQCVLFNDRGIQRLFDGSWHQLKLLLKPRRITCFLDDVLIEEQLLEEAMPIYVSGWTQVAKVTKPETTVAVEIQKLRLYCNPEQSDKETACEIYSAVRLQFTTRCNLSYLEF
uniref:Si:ch211-106n13.3 n=1 Tax=Scleropages formosus TaxID=113540 RepID=A0A8C9RJB1_SCLFO